MFDGNGINNSVMKKFHLLPISLVKKNFFSTISCRLFYLSYDFKIHIHIVCY